MQKETHVEHGNKRKAEKQKQAKKLEHRNKHGTRKKIFQKHRHEHGTRKQTRKQTWNTELNMRKFMESVNGTQNRIWNMEMHIKHTWNMNMEQKLH